MTTTDPAEAIVHVDIDADPEVVWAAISTHDGLASWIGEGSTVGAEVGDDLRVNDVVTGRERRGYLDEVTPGRRLGYTWWPDTEPDQATRVSISLEPIQTGTRVTVIESRPLVPANPVDASPRASVAGAGDWSWRMALLAVAPSSVRHITGLQFTCATHG